MRVGSKRRGRVLVVDDNLSLAENIAEFLALEGFETEIAASGFEAVLKALPVPPDVVVTDYRLPDMDGASVLRALRQMGLRVRAVVVSACTDDATVADAHDAGAAFLSKPTDLDILGRLLCEDEAARRPSAHPDRDDRAIRVAHDVLGDAAEE